MPSKRKKPASSSPRHKYTTREIMDITEKRRQEKEAAERGTKPDKKVEPVKSAEPVRHVDPVREAEPIRDVEPVIEKAVPPAPEPPVVIEREDIIEVINKKNKILANAVVESLIYILLMIAFLIFCFNLPETRLNAISGELNVLIAYGSFLVLSIIQGPCVVNGVILNTSYFNISLQGDLVAVYSIELLIVFALLFALFQKMTRIKRWVVFISLFPLAVVANIARVVMACGMALNDGPANADRYFHGILAGSVFIIVIIGLVFLEYLSSPE